MAGEYRICPRCGRSSREVPFIGPLCRDCYVEVYGVARLPERVVFTYCQYCGRYKYQGGWNEPTGSVEDTLVNFLHMYLTKKLRPTEHIEEAWIREIRLERPFTGPGIYTARVVVEGESNGVIAREEKLVRVQVNAAVCPYCTNRITKRGYNAVIQVRSSSGRLDKGLRERIDSFLAGMAPSLADAIIGVEEEKEGFDLLVSDPSVARMIASKMRSAFLAKTIETFKLVGRNPDGSRKGRLTISVRVPDIKPGDLLVIGDEHYFYLARSRGGAIMVNLDTGREEHFDSDHLWSMGFKEYPGGVELRRYMLLSRGPSTTVFLDAETGYERVIEVPSDTVRVYVSDFREGREYKVFLAGGRVYVVGEANEVSE